MAKAQPVAVADDMQIGPYACFLFVDPGSTDWPDMSELAEGGLPLLVPTQQMPGPQPISRLAMLPDGHPKRVVDCLDHLLRHKMGVDLPDVLTIALDDPAQTINDALSAEGLGDLDLDTVAVLGVPLWSIPAADRAEVTQLCRYP